MNTHFSQNLFDPNDPSFYERQAVGHEFMAQELSKRIEDIDDNSQRAEDLQTILNHRVKARELRATAQRLRSKQN